MEQDDSVIRGEGLNSADRRLRVAGLVVGLAILTLGVVSAIVYVWPEETVIDREIVSEVTFPVYAPKELPSGYRLDKPRTSVSDDMLSYAFVTTDSKNVTVTVQPIPVGFDMSQMIGNGSISTTLMNSGTLYNLSAGIGVKYLLHTGDALVFITSPDNIDTSAISSLASSIIRHK